MATRIQRLCDFHLVKKEEEVPGTTRRVPINYKKVLIDACDECYTENFEIPLGIMRDLLEELGARADDAAPQPPIGAPKKKIACPETDCGYSAGSRTSFRSHMPDAHGVSLAVYEGRRGETIEGEKIEYFCDEADCAGGFTTPQGKGAHMAAEHGYTGPNNSNGQQPLPEPEPTPARRTAKKTPAKKTAKKAS